MNHPVRDQYNKIIQQERKFRFIIVDDLGETISSEVMSQYDVLRFCIYIKTF